MLDLKSDYPERERAGGNTNPSMPSAAAEQALLRIQEELDETIQETIQAKNQLVVEILGVVFGVSMFIYGISQADARVYICTSIGLVVTALAVILLINTSKALKAGVEKNDILVRERSRYLKLLNRQ